ncbi:MAG: stage V sporulation protein AD [Clostridia bacterium]|nr:stage V sporulation protein AD [Clostridia bacterium]
MSEIIKLLRPVYVAAEASVAGHEESEGPLGALFDVALRGDDLFGKSTWEKAEAELLRSALLCALEKARLSDGDLQMILSGDLVNQCISSAYGLSDTSCPFIGLYGACSTAAQGLLLGSLLSSAYGLRIASLTSSHNATAERQFRFPLEYGGQRPPTAQWTVTGAGAFILTCDCSEAESISSLKEGFIPKICEVLPGRIVDAGINDANNMGAAMAPAAADTLCRYFEDGGEMPDLIATGDLGYEGSEILKDIMLRCGKDISAVHTDCGLLIFDREGQDKHSGGSGCGCSAAVLAAKLLREVRCGSLSDLLFVGTGALMNTMSLCQGADIPAIAHLVHVRGAKKEEN